jgi:transposase-like protein
MAKRKRRFFTPEFKADAVKLVTTGGRTVAQVVHDLDLTESALREWLKQAEADAGKGPPGALTTDEKTELARLRQENKVLRMERDLLKKATAFFAREST